jgi:hypothetical protein
MPVGMTIQIHCYRQTGQMTGGHFKVHGKSRYPAAQTAWTDPGPINLFEDPVLETGQ